MRMRLVVLESEISPAKRLIALELAVNGSCLCVITEPPSFRIVGLRLNSYTFVGFSSYER